LRALPVVTAAVWLFVIVSRYHAFGAESRGIVRLLDRLQPNQRLLGLIDNPRSGVAPFYPYLHVGCWYQVQHGGIADFSFAEFYPNRFRYRRAMDPPLPAGVEWFPAAFDWKRHGGAAYDYFLVRSSPGAHWWPAKNAPTHMAVVAEYGEWRVYQQSAQ
jgi:hypothetical protein